MSKSPWTHSICDRCWEKRYPNQQPFRVKDEFRSIERCCFCEGVHMSGIYVRNDPTDRNMKCGGVHDDN